MFLPGELHRQRGLVGYMTKQLSKAQHIYLRGWKKQEAQKKKLDRWEGNQKTKLRTNRKREDFKKWEEEMESTE